MLNFLFPYPALYCPDSGKNRKADGVCCDNARSRRSVQGIGRAYAGKKADDGHNSAHHGYSPEALAHAHRGQRREDYQA